MTCSFRGRRAKPCCSTDSRAESRFEWIPIELARRGWKALFELLKMPRPRGLAELGCLPSTAITWQ